MEPHSGEGLVVGGSGEGVYYFERGQVEVNDGEERLKQRGASQGLEWRVLHSASLLLAVPSSLSLPPSKVTLSLAFLGPRLSATITHLYLWLSVLLSGLALPVTLASWKDPGSG